MTYITNENVEKFIILVNILSLLFFLGDIPKRYLSLEDGDEEQSNFGTKLKNLYKGKKTTEKDFFKK